MGRSIFCSVCKKEKEPENAQQSYCKSCKAENRKKLKEKVISALPLEKRPRRYGKCYDCPDCGKLKENLKQSYCNACRSRRSKEWALKTGRVQRSQTGLCPCGAERAPGQRYFCAPCKAEDSRKYREIKGQTQESRDNFNKWYKANRESILSKRRTDGFAKLKISARNITNNAIAAGILVRGACEICGTIENVEAHHEDYTKALDVNWLCTKHHKELHRGILKLIKES